MWVSGADEKRLREASESVHRCVAVVDGGADAYQGYGQPSREFVREIKCAVVNPVGVRWTGDDTLVVCEGGYSNLWVESLVCCGDDVGESWFG